MPANHVPNALQIFFAQGFSFDPQAASATCSTAQANPNNNTCPSGSRIARGTIDVTLSGLLTGNDQAQIAMYQMAPQAPGDIAGVAFYFYINDTKNQFTFQGTSVGRLHTLSGDPQFGTTIEIDKLQFPSIPPGINVTLNDMKLDLGTPDLAASQFNVTSSTGSTPTKKHHRKHRRKRHKKHHRRKTTARHAGAVAAKLNPKPLAHALLTNPGTCTGSWPVRVSWSYSDGIRSVDAAAPCAVAPS